MEERPHFLTDVGHPGPISGNLGTNTLGEQDYVLSAVAAGAEHLSQLGDVVLGEWQVAQLVGVVFAGADEQGVPTSRWRDVSVLAGQGHRDHKHDEEAYQTTALNTARTSSISAFQLDQ